MAASRQPVRTSSWASTSGQTMKPRSPLARIGLLPTAPNGTSLGAARRLECGLLGHVSADGQGSPPHWERWPSNLMHGRPANYSKERYRRSKGAPRRSLRSPRAQSRADICRSAQHLSSPAATPSIAAAELSIRSPVVAHGETLTVIRAGPTAQKFPQPRQGLQEAATSSSVSAAMPDCSGKTCRPRLAT